MGDHTLLFDLNRDPMERHDLSGSLEYAQTLVRLRKLLTEHTARYTPEALTEDGRFLTYDAPTSPAICPGAGWGSTIMITVWILFTDRENRGTALF